MGAQTGAAFLCETTSMTCEASALTMVAFDLSPNGQGRLWDALRHGAIELMCPCHAVVTFRLRQREANDTLVRATEEDSYCCLRLHDLERYIEKGGPRPTPITNCKRIPPTAVAFVRRADADDLSRLTSRPELNEIFAIRRLVRRYFPAYVLGPRLTRQKGSGAFTRMLRNSFGFLGWLGLVSERASSPPYAHTSVIMIERAVLGMPTYDELAPFLEDPSAFFAMLLSRSAANTHGLDRETFHRRLLNLFDRYWSPHLEEQIPALLASDCRYELASDVADALVAALPWRFEGLWPFNGQKSDPYPILNGVALVLRPWRWLWLRKRLVRMGIKPIWDLIHGAARWRLRVWRDQFWEFAGWVDRRSVAAKTSFVVVPPILFFAGIASAEVTETARNLPWWLPVGGSVALVVAYVTGITSMVIGHAKDIARLQGQVDAELRNLNSSIQRIETKLDGLSQKPSRENR